MSISFALCSKCWRIFWWNMGLSNSMLSLSPAKCLFFNSIVICCWPLHCSGRDVNISNSRIRKDLQENICNLFVKLCETSKKPFTPPVKGISFICIDREPIQFCKLFVIISSCVTDPLRWPWDSLKKLAITEDKSWRFPLQSYKSICLHSICKFWISID